MQIKFLGTGAADWDWSQPLEGERRGSCSTLLDGHILLDAGATALANLARSNVAPGEITDIVLTHSHSDHFNIEAVRVIAGVPARREKLRFYGSAEACSAVGGDAACTAITRGDKFTVGDLKFTALPANHLLENFAEETFNYLIETVDGKRLYYALDGAWINTLARHLLGNKPLDMIVWDATTGTTWNDWRFAEHNDLKMIGYMADAMRKIGLITDKTVQIFDHIARTLWPSTAEERAATAAEYGGILAYDTMTWDL